MLLVQQHFFAYDYKSTTKDRDANHNGPFEEGGKPEKVRC